MRPEIKAIVDSMRGKTVEEMNTEFAIMDLQLTTDEEAEVISYLDCCEDFSQAPVRKMQSF